MDISQASTWLAPSEKEEAAAICTTAIPDAPTDPSPRQTKQLPDLGPWQPNWRRCLKS